MIEPPILRNRGRLRCRNRGYRQLSIRIGVFRAERRAAPSRPALAMCLPVDPASIAVPSGDRPA